jgi:cytosine/adenosine deaminase-related metal-dependent hydrolase
MHLIWAGYALPGPGELKTDYAVVVDGSRVIDSGDRAVMQAAYPDAEVLGGQQYIMLPGFINAHDHGRAIGSASLGVPDDILECWLPMLGAQPHIPPYLAAAYDGIQQLKSGITGTAHSHNPATWAGMPAECDESIWGYRDAGIRVAFHPPMVDQNLLVYADEDSFIAGLPTELQTDARARTQKPPFTTDEYLDLCTRLYDHYHDAENETVHIQVSPAGGQWCSDGLIMASVEWAKAHQTRVQMHMLETQYQRAYAHRKWGKSFIQHLEEIGALGEWLTLAHMVWLDEGDYERLKHHQVGIAHNPSSNLRLRSGIAHAFKCFGRVAVGLDGHALDDDQDYWRELRLAATLMRYTTTADLSDPKFAHILLDANQLAAARMTFGTGNKCFALHKGMFADLQLLDLDAVRGAWAPADWPEPEYIAAFLLQRANKSHVRHVMVGGKWVVRDGVCLTLDEKSIAAEIKAALNAQDRTILRTRLEAAQQLTPHIRKFYRAWE